MFQLHWDTKDKISQAVFAEGRAVIEQVTRNNSEVFVPQIYDMSGQPVIDPRLWFDSFEQAESVLVAHLPSLDERGKSRGEYLALLSQAIEYAQTALEDRPVAHQQRLRNVQRWVEGKGRPDYSKMERSSGATDYQTKQFDWKQSANIYRTHTDFGVAMITEYKPQPYAYGGISPCEVQIQDESGVILKDYFEEPHDFLEAERRVRTLLTELSQPFVDETHLEYLEFVINICLKRLSPQTDLMTLVRIQAVMTWMGEVLP